MGATAAIASIATSATQIVSPFIQASGQRQEGRQRQAAYEYNARIEEMEAEQIETAGKITQIQIAERQDSLRSTQEALYAKSGVKASGSALQVMLQSATDYEFDRAIERYNTTIQASRARSRAAMLRYTGEASRRAGEFSAGLTLLQAMPKIAEAAGTISNRIPRKKTPEKLGPGY